ncbi:MAG: nucleotidyltransferase domain-containing protein [Anaerolineae bacterium]|nr:nucleotidyltransferase domain-containing protein [Anaerolineae bacterium]
MTERVSNLADLQRYRDEILRIAAQHHVRQIRVFGSLVNGNLTPTSDIDFLVEFEPDYKLRDHIRLVQALQNLLGRQVEVADQAMLRDELRPSILASVRPI